ncbi:oxepin-CoA hydrolase, alternative type [Undibacterium sp. RuRC25W]|uniref:oxepin-CoA hydrolase, alternative type n=1 Tax=Undibacterium sp. RuRC25W TaxID=3413047 RepID=UPI003BF0EF48
MSNNTAPQQNPALLSEQRGSVLILTNNNPSARNALSLGFYQALPSTLAAAQEDPSIAAIVLTGAGDFFCSGGDLNQLKIRRELPTEQRGESLEGLHTLIRAIRHCNKPVIAAIEGGAAGAGMSLAFACDMVVAARDAIFSVAYIKVGLTPDGGITQFLSEILSRHVLIEFSLTGDRIGSERLHALGALNRMTERGGALNEAIALAERLAQGPQRATARIKKLCQKAYENDFETQMMQEAVYMVESQGDNESAEGIAAFLEKRQANFSALRGK